MTNENRDNEQELKIVATATTVSNAIGSLWTLCVSVAGVWIFLYFVGAVVHRLGM